MTTYLAGARAAAASVLSAALGPDVAVVDAPRNVDPLTVPLVILAPVRVEPFGTACPGPRITVDVWCVPPESEPGPGDDSAEQLTDSVLSALDAAGVDWTAAERGTYADHPAWKITTEWSP